MYFMDILLKSSICHLTINRKLISTKSDTVNKSSDFYSVALHLDQDIYVPYLRYFLFNLLLYKQDIGTS